MKPKKEVFQECVSKYGGNLTNVAKAFGVQRLQVYRWMHEDEEFKSIVDDARMSLFDECLSTARVVSLGIPEIVNGKIVGWVERPDSGMLRYLLGTLGRNEGFGEKQEIELSGKGGSALTIEIIDRAEQVDKQDGQS